MIRPGTAPRYSWRISPLDAEELDRRLRLAIPLPGRAQALRAKNARSAPLPAHIAAADFPCSAADSASMRSPAMASAADHAAAPQQQSRRCRSKETMDITNNERMRLAASAYRAYIEHAAQMELPLNEDAVDDDILADLIAGLHHYADSQGIDFENAVASGQAAYDRHRASQGWGQSRLFRS